MRLNWTQVGPGEVAQETILYRAQGGQIWSQGWKQAAPLQVSHGYKGCPWAEGLGLFTGLSSSSFRRAAYPSRHKVSRQCLGPGPRIAGKGEVAQ